jgi:hypothetical protein
MCPNHCDWLGIDGLETQSPNADRSVVTDFLQAHPTDYATKKLQVSRFIGSFQKSIFFLTVMDTLI